MNRNGRIWARWFLAGALLVSVVGNVAHTVLAESTVTLWLRVPGAIIWPLFTFGGIEILVRIIWERSFTHRVARNLILFPAIPAAITSYEHLRSLLLMMGENEFIAAIGPLAIDGMMVGCTVVLLFTRELPVPPVQEKPAQEVAATQPLEPDIDWDRELKEWSTPVPVSPAPVSAPPLEMSPRAPRATWDARKVVEMILDGEKTPQIVEATEAGRASVERLRKVTKLLQTDPRAAVDTKKEKVREEHVSVIRELVSR